MSKPILRKAGNIDYYRFFIYTNLHMLYRNQGDYMQFYKKLLFVFSIIVLVAISGCSSKDTTQTNNANKINSSTNITSEKALELADEYTATGSSFGTPSLTIYNNVQVWKIQVIDPEGPNKIAPIPKTIHYIYIDSSNGEIVR